VRDSNYSTAPEQEFARRCLDADTCHAALLKSLRSALRKNHGERGFDVRDHAANLYLCFRLLLEQVAKENPGAPPQPTTEEWASYLEQTLASRPFAELGEIAKELPFSAQSQEYTAKLLWIWQHGPDQWRQLFDAFLDPCNRAQFDRLAEIVPRDEIDAWDVFGGQSYSRGEFEAFCRWLPAQYAEVLTTHFQHPDADWRACAYQNYLTKAPEPILRHRWRHADELPAWQSALLDRRLFAPEAIRPAAVVYDTQEVEADLRLQDPFNHRSF
jgi:hypothetical protein